MLILYSLCSGCSPLHGVNSKWKRRLYVVIIPSTSSRVNPHSIAARISRKLRAWSRRDIWNLSDCNWTRTHKHLVCKQTLNHLAKLANLAIWSSLPLQANWLWVRVLLKSLKKQISRCLFRYFYIFSEN